MNIGTFVQSDLLLTEYLYILGKPHPMTRTVNKTHTSNYKGSCGVAVLLAGGCQQKKNTLTNSKDIIFSWGSDIHL
jgi:hypothetical protein